jgi:hypothetical protein
MVQQTNKNGDKKRQFPEMLICTALQQNKISKIKLSGVSDLFADTESILPCIFWYCVDYLYSNETNH